MKSRRDLNQSLYHRVIISSGNMNMKNTSQSVGHNQQGQTNNLKIHFWKRYFRKKYTFDKYTFEKYTFEEKTLRLKKDIFEKDT